MEYYVYLSNYIYLHISYIPEISALQKYYFAQNTFDSGKSVKVSLFSRNLHSS